MPTRALRVLVSGSRDWPFDWSHLIHEKLDRLPRRAVIVHGMCPSGVDAFAEDWIQTNHRQADRFPAEWRKYGLKAGMIRNQQMLDHVMQDGQRLVLCFFWDIEISKGTKGMAFLAAKAKVPLVCYKYDGADGLLVTHVHPD